MCIFQTYCCFKLFHRFLTDLSAVSVGFHNVACSLMFPNLLILFKSSNSLRLLLNSLGRSGLAVLRVGHISCYSYTRRHFGLILIPNICLISLVFLHYSSCDFHTQHWGEDTFCIFQWSTFKINNDQKFKDKIFDLT